MDCASVVSAVIGGLIALCGVLITLHFERKIQKEERVNRAKPIMINYPSRAIPERAHTPLYHFKASEETSLGEVYGAFKNTDNGIMFLNCIETETKKYLPQNNSAVDKSTAFIIVLHLVVGETLTQCRIHCQDIFGNKYYYDAEYNYDNNKQNRIVIGNIQPEK